MTTASVPECKCSLRTSLVGDGCSACNPKLAAEIDAENAAEERLHAAAPELLEALNNILVGMEASGGWTGDDGLFDAGMRAYNKATGVRP